jgi:hypothetical protein
MRLTPLDLLAFVGVLTIVAVVLFRLDHGRPRGPIVLASPTLTPGALNPDVTQQTIGSTICVHGWTRSIRPPASYTSALKRQQLREFGLRGPPADYQEDHLISLELGGSPADRRNLWPEPYPRASQVDRIENQLNARVCAGELTLAAAQQQEAALKHEHG